MTKSAVELAAQISVTAAFIDTDPTDIVITRTRPTTRTATGGTAKLTAAPLPPQRVKIIDQSGSSSPNVVGDRTVDGTENVQTVMVLGLPTLDVREGDTFDVGGFRYVVPENGLYPDNGYERRAVAERHNPRGA